MQFLEKDLLTLAIPGPGSAEWNQERIALAAEVLRDSGSLRLRVRGESMLPALWPGDLAEIQSCTVQQVSPGEIVLALREGRFFLHRLLALRPPNGFLLRGDSMPGADPEFSDYELVGKLVRRQGNIRSLAASRWSRAIGYLFCYCGPARRAALKLYSQRERRSRAYQAANGAPEVGAADIGTS